MTALSLNAHDRHELSLIEEALAGTDPRFAAKLSAFSRLANGEAMPERERIRAGRQHPAGRAVRGLRPGQPGTLRWISVAVWLLISIALLSTALALGDTGTSAPCARWQGLVCTRQRTPRVPRVRPGRVGAPAGRGGAARSPAPQ